MDVKALRVGLDIGKRVDPSAVCIATAEKIEVRTQYNIHRIERLPMVRYVEQAEVLADILIRSWSQYQKQLIKDGITRYPAPRILIDITGVGDGVIEIILANPQIRPLFRSAKFQVYPTRFTHGDKINRRGANEIYLGKEALASRLQMLSQRRRISIPVTIKARNPYLLKEFDDFDINTDEASGRSTYGAIRPGSHDDQIISLGLATLDEVKPMGGKAPSKAVTGRTDIDYMLDEANEAIGFHQDEEMEPWHIPGTYRYV